VSLADGLEKVFTPIANFLKRSWIKSLIWTVVIVYVLLVLSQFAGGWWLYHLIYDDLEKTGTFANLYFLKAAATALTMTSLAFLPTVFGLWLRFRTRTASLITGAVFVGWLVLLGALTAYTPRGSFNRLTGQIQCTYFLSEDGTVALRPIDQLVDRDTGQELKPADKNVIKEWRSENPGKTPNCNLPAAPPREPQRLAIADAHDFPWFGPRGAQVWYARDRDGSCRYYDRPGKDPVAGEELNPVTNEIVYEAQRLQDERSRTMAVQAAAEVERGKARDAVEQHQRMAKAASEQRQRKATDAANALAEGKYDLVLTDCPNGEGNAQDDPCVSLHQEAAHKEASALVKQSQREVQQYELEEAIRNAQQALKLEPNNDPAKNILRLAQTLKRADAEPKL
jgi:hypothetical protein